MKKFAVVATLISVITAAVTTTFRVKKAMEPIDVRIRNAHKSMREEIV